MSYCKGSSYSFPATLLCRRLSRKKLLLLWIVYTLQYRVFIELAHATIPTTSFPQHKNPEISGNPLAKDPESSCLAEGGTTRADQYTRLSPIVRQVALLCSDSREKYNIRFKHEELPAFFGREKSIGRRILPTWTHLPPKKKQEEGEPFWLEKVPTWKYLIAKFALFVRRRGPFFLSPLPSHAFVSPSPLLVTSALVL